MAGLEVFDGDLDEDSDDSDDFEDDSDDFEEVSDSWYVTAVKSFIELKEEAEADLTCDVDNNYDNWRLNGSDPFSSALCEEKLAAASKITDAMLHGKGRCTVEVWRCFSKVLEGKVKFVENMEDIFG